MARILQQIIGMPIHLVPGRGLSAARVGSRERRG
jgi:hypothetical protein